VKKRKREGDGSFAVEHGESARRITAEYRVWKSMMTRCHNEKAINYADYGGRGIAVCARWRSYESFLHDVGRRPSAMHELDRIDNDGNYEPGNVRWSTRSEQAQNKRTNRMVTWRGETFCLAEWARRIGISRLTLAKRLDAGWDVGRTLETPVQTAAESGATKLSISRAREIKAVLSLHAESYRSVANRFGVSPTLVGYIACGKCWRDA
jgi:hypothetical protein